MTEPLLLAIDVLSSSWLYEWLTRRPTGRVPGALDWRALRCRVDALRGVADHRRGTRSRGVARCGGRAIRTAASSRADLAARALAGGRRAAVPAHSRLTVGAWFVIGRLLRAAIPPTTRRP